MLEPRPANSVTLANGRLVTVTAANYADLARENLAAYAAKGLNVDGASIVQAFRQLADLAPPLPSVNEASERVLGNPLVRASAAIFESTPTGLQSVWGGASDGVFDAGATVAGKVKAAATAAADYGARLAKLLPGALGEANTTLRVVVVSLAVVAVAGGGAYAIHKFKR